MRRHYLELVDYDRWATLRLLDFAEPSAPPVIQKWMSHMVLEREVWSMRLLSGDFSQEVWTVLSWPEIRHKLELTQKQLVQFLGGLDNKEFQKLLEWSPAGEHAGTSLKDILTHLLQYGANVRGRVLILMDQESARLPDISFLTYSQRKPAPVIQWRIGQS